MPSLNKIILSIYCLMTLGTFSSFKKIGEVELFPKLAAYCSTLSTEFDQIPDERKLKLQDISSFIVDQRKANKPANLLYVCTSNSRRSHMAQVWSQIATNYFKLDSVYTFSGGTEQTRVNINAINALARSGIEIYTNNQGDNPLRYIKVGNQVEPWAIFSKKYTDSTNPTENFAAIMVCTEADRDCPIVDGADFRMGLPYDDPKEFDSSPLKDAKYDERCRQIAREMFYIMYHAASTIED